VVPAPRRWLIVVALFFVTFGMATPLAAYGVFLPVLAEAFGWSRGAISAALSLNLLLGGLAGFGFGALADRRGPRLVLAFTAGLASLAFGLMSTVNMLWQLFALTGLLGGVGMSSFYLLSASTVMRWFDDRRGLALGLVLLGFNVGYLTSGPLAAWLIDAIGWRHAYAVLGTGCGLLTVVAALTVRSPRGDETPRPRHSRGGDIARGPATLELPGATLKEALADPRLWFLNLAWMLGGGVAIMITVHVVPFARDQGLPLTVASLAITAYGIGAALGRLGAAAVSDSAGATPAIGVAYALEAAALVAVIAWPSPGVLLPAMLAFGFGFAASDTLLTKVIPEVFGVRSIGAVMGVLSMGWRFGAALGPAAAGFLYDATGSYAVPFGAAPIVVLASWGFFSLGRRRRH